MKLSVSFVNKIVFIRVSSPVKSLLLVVRVEVAILAHTLRVVQLVGVLALVRQRIPSKQMVAMVAHSFSVMLHVGVGASRDILLLSASFLSLLFLLPCLSPLLFNISLTKIDEAFTHSTKRLEPNNRNENISGKPEIVVHVVIHTKVVGKCILTGYSCRRYLQILLSTEVLENCSGSVSIVISKNSFTRILQSLKKVHQNQTLRNKHVFNKAQSNNTALVI